MCRLSGDSFVQDLEAAWLHSDNVSSTQDSLRTLKPGTGLQLRPNKLLRLLSNNL